MPYRYKHRIELTMNIPYLDDHMDSAALLYRQRCRCRQTALAGALRLAQQEQLLRIHLQTLSRCAPLSSEPSREADHFVDLAARMLSPLEEIRQAGFDRAVDMLAEEGSTRQAAYNALALLPPPEDDERLLAQYRQNKSIRPLLFNLWREQSWKVPAGLVTAAELRENDTELQIAALRYAAGRPEIGIELFSAYYRSVSSGAPRPELSGHLMATALWGGLLRGDKDLAKPLLRCIEWESEPQELYYLLRLAAIMALPDAIAIIKHFGKKNPEAAAELLALHGTEPALEALIEIGTTGDLPRGVLDAWKWVSGLDLAAGPRLRLVSSEGKPAPGPDAFSIEHWWRNRPELGEGQRMLMGQVLTSRHLFHQCRYWAGRFSRNLLDLLSFTIGSPLGVTADALQTTRCQAIEQKVQVLIDLEAVDDSD